MKNVFGLNRKENLSFECQSLRWSNYVGEGMNLGEEHDQSYSIASCLATAWQDHIDQGNSRNLPDLYLIQIAIGGQGVTEKCMWYPDREKKLIPGKINQVDISLFPLAVHIFSLIDQSFHDLGIDYEIIGVHWRGGERDLFEAPEYLHDHLETIYVRMIDCFNEILKDPKIILHKIACRDWAMETDPTGKILQNIGYTNHLFDKISEKYRNISIFDPQQLPQYRRDVRGNGLFQPDMLHYMPDVDREVAELIMHHEI